MLIRQIWGRQRQTMRDLECPLRGILMGEIADYLRVRSARQLVFLLVVILLVYFLYTSLMSDEVSANVIGVENIKFEMKSA